MTRGLPHDRTDAADTRSRLLDALLSAFVALVLPVLFCVAHVAAPLRYAYPALAFLLAGYLNRKDSPWYAGFTVWLFCVAPFVRRLVDEQAGFDFTSPVLLAPYVACAFAGLRVLQFSDRRPVEARPFLAMLLCIGYGLILAFANGRLLSGIVDAMKWSAGPLFALYILSGADRAKEHHRTICSAILLALPAMAIYGIAQYFAPAKWDADWMTNVQLVDPGLVSMGNPQPFELRVFSTMNSPGSFAAFAMVGILVALQRRAMLALPLVALMALALLLTQYRAVWAGTLLGISYLILAGNVGVRLRIIAAAAAVLLLMTSSALVPQLRQAISQRIDTISHLQADRSGEDRMHQYDEFLSDDSGDIIIGSGLAVDGASRRLDGKTSAVIDSGIIVVFTALGIGVGTILLLALASSTAISFSRFAGRSPSIIAARAIALASFSQLPFGAVFVGESGFLVWLFLGLAGASAHLGRQLEQEGGSAKEMGPAIIEAIEGGRYLKGQLRGV